MISRCIALIVACLFMPGIASAAPLQIGQTIRPPILTDLEGRPAALPDIDRALVVVFTSITCPASVKYAVHRAQIHREYGSKGVRIIAVNANFNETDNAVKTHLRDHPAPYPTLRDPQAAFADLLGATHTPQAFLFDKHWRLRYRGEIDNGWGIPENTTSRGLYDALDALLANRDIARPEVPAFGCEIRRRPRISEAAPGAPTFHRHIAPFLQNRCQDCHRPGGIGRVPFLDHLEVVAWASQMRDSIQSRTMPPWQAKPGYGDFKGSRWLSDDEIHTFIRWIEAGMPEGDPDHAPPPRTFPDTWALGLPDLILEPEEAYPLNALGGDEYRCFVFPVNLDQDRYVSAIEVLPGAREAVHHVSVYIDISGKARLLQDDAPKPGYPSFGGIGVPIYESLGGWAPGNTPFVLPDGVGRHLPAGSDIVMQVHYHKIGRAVEDRSRLGIYFAQKPVAQRLYEESVNSRLLFIPPNVKRHKVTGSLAIDKDMHLLGILPHMHLLGTDMKVTATYPDGTVVPLVHVEPWDFNWQETYLYKNPVPLPRGTRIALEAHYDNSADNPRNPNKPPKFVRWGEASTDEMCIAFLYVTHDDENLLK